MADISIIAVLTLANYFLAAFVLSYIITKVRVGKLFWYGMTLFFFSFFAHVAHLFIAAELVGLELYILFFISFFLLASMVGLFLERKLWEGEPKAVKFLSEPTPHEMNVMERERKLRSS